MQYMQWREPLLWKSSDAQDKLFTLLHEAQTTRNDQDNPPRSLHREPTMSHLPSGTPLKVYRDSPRQHSGRSRTRPRPATVLHAPVACGILSKTRPLVPTAAASAGNQIEQNPGRDVPAGGKRHKTRASDARCRHMAVVGRNLGRTTRIAAKKPCKNRRGCPPHKRYMPGSPSPHFPLSYARARYLGSSGDFKWRILSPLHL